MSLSDAAKIFDARAEEYDSWYEQSVLFDIELEAIQAGVDTLMRPWLEVGVGPGRFAQALGIDFGLDPALSPLQLAHGRSIMSINGVGEQLPVQSQSIGTVYLFFTLCFLPDPVTVIREFHRVLKPGGFMVIGFVPAESAWGKDLARKGRGNNPYYRYARFRTVAEAVALLIDGGFDFTDARSTLFQPPSATLYHEHPVSGAEEDAGFCVVTAKKKGAYIETC